jgi:lipopolysaccharide/colanic/teichoic acid biosynthesis glycosyltransferase
MMLKTFSERLFAALIFIVLLPLIFLFSLIVVVDNKGPAIYKARRVGKNGKEFKMWKFRTMIINADKIGPVLTKQGDERITPVGTFLRRYSLDELPQIINVIKGEMSLVGPRPEVPEIVAMYSKKQLRVLSVKPGITGLSQINGRDDLPFEKKLNIENEYINSISISTDIKILFSTIPVVLRGTGARY